MQARILEKSQEHVWDEFIKNHPLATIHQSSAWGHFQETIPERGKYWIAVLEEGNKIIGGTMLIRHKLPKGFSWLYAARGPLLNYDSENLEKEINALLSAISLIANQEKSIFLRIDPPLQSPIHIKNFHITHHGFQPEHTLILDITKSEEEILKQMKPKGRYNIHLAEKKGVKISTLDVAKKAQLDHEIGEFYKILSATAERDSFNVHGENFYKKMIETLIPHCNAELYLAHYGNKIIGGIIATFFNDTATYYYGASSDEHREVMANYLLQWHAIKEAKARGMKYYDFLGIAPEQAKNHPWQGVTEFKKKFGGTEVSYAPPMEFAFKKSLHALYRLYKKF